jgi:AcrR family transcriptional regulator
METEKDYHHGDLKTALIEAALKQLAQGVKVNELSVRALASELGVSKGAPYRHFPSVEALIAALAGKGFSMLKAQLAKSLAENTSLKPLNALGTAYIQFASENRQLYKTMFYFSFDEISQYPILAVPAQESFAILKDVVMEHKKNENADNMDIDSASLAAWAYVHGLADLIVNRLNGVADETDIETIQLLTTALIDGL